MDSRQEFEKWLNSLEKPISGMQTGKLNEYRSHMCWEVWQACQALNDAKIAELEATLDRLLEKLGEQPYEQSAYALITEIEARK